MEAQSLSVVDGRLPEIRCDDPPTQFSSGRDSSVRYQKKTSEISTRMIHFHCATYGWKKKKKKKIGKQNPNPSANPLSSSFDATSV